MATIRGEPVDRPAVSFYEINGLDEDPSDDSPFNIYSAPSWRPLLDLAREKTDHIVATGCMGLDPVEPPPQGDVSLAYVRGRYGQQFVLFGNLEASDVENLPVREFEKKVATALEEGTAGTGRGFVLMPSACPYGREITPLALANYEKMIEMIEGL